ncbi:hypothetical protein PCE1_003642 [Barthelona sp. PCE]
MRGTNTFPAENVIKNAAELGFKFDAQTGREFSVYHMSCLPNAREYAKSVLLDMIETPSFDHDRVEREKKIVFEEASLIDSIPREKVFQQLHAAAYGPRGLGNTILGTDNVDSFTTSDLNSFFEQHFKNAYFFDSTCSTAEFDTIDLPSDPNSMLKTGYTHFETEHTDGRDRFGILFETASKDEAHQFTWHLDQQLKHLRSDNFENVTGFMLQYSDRCVFGLMGILKRDNCDLNEILNVVKSNYEDFRNDKSNSLNLETLEAINSNTLYLIEKALSTPHIDAHIYSTVQESLYNPCIITSGKKSIWY